MWEFGYEESWMLKNWCFWTVVWRRLLRLPWTARRSNESILEEISPEYSLEGLMLMLKLQYMAKWYKEMTHWKAWGEGDDRGYDAWMAPSNQWTWVWVSSRSWWWIGKSGMLQSMGSQRVRHNCDWTDLLMLFSPFVPPSPSSAVSKSPFSTSVPPFLPWK